MVDEAASRFRLYPGRAVHGVWILSVPGVGFEPTRPFRGKRF
jgi:hypothetical protein